MTDSKLGLHICRWNGEILNFAECQPAIMKSIDHNPDMLAKFRAVSPGTLWIGRVVLEGFDQRADFANPKLSAQTIAGIILANLKGCRYDVLEGINEPNLEEDPEKAKNICELNIHLARLLKKEGFQYAAYSFAATRPHLPLWPYLEPALKEADYLAMHAYGPGPLFHESYWYLYAYRLSWEALSGETRRHLKGMLFTEYGIAKGLLWTNKDVGWKANVRPEIQPRHYGNDLKISDGQLDCYVKGATIFQTGDIGGGWGTFEIEELLPGLKSHICSFVRPGVNTCETPNNGEGEMEEPIRVLMPDGKTVKPMELEEYLRGVLPLEMGKDAPLEALKAQAVAARCYAKSAIKGPRHKDRGADICATTHCQVWGPNTRVETDRAVKETKGITATHDGQVISAFYFGHCDGKTRKPTEAHPTPWKQDLPYTKPVPCICGYKEMYGHGVGMCQRGAMAMALRGATFEQILWHYYQGCTVGGKVAPPDIDYIQEAMKEVQAIKGAHQVMGNRIERLEEHLSKV